MRINLITCNIGDDSSIFIEISTTAEVLSPASHHIYDWTNEVGVPCRINYNGNHRGEETAV